MPIIDAEYLNAVVTDGDTLTVILADDSEVRFELENGEGAAEELQEKGLEVMQR